jgi:hypothetical protein
MFLFFDLSQLAYLTRPRGRLLKGDPKSTPQHCKISSASFIKKARHLSSDADKTNPGSSHLYAMTVKASDQQVGEKFGLTYLAVNRRIGVFKDFLRKNRGLQNRLNRVIPLIKI